MDEHDNTPLCLTGEPLLLLLQDCCSSCVCKGCAPVAFVVLSRLPVTATRKHDQSVLPPPFPENRRPFFDGNRNSLPLSSAGNAGQVVAKAVAECLNLTLETITSTSSFAVLGGDSLAALKVVCALYAQRRLWEGTLELWTDPFVWVAFGA